MRGLLLGLVLASATTAIAEPKAPAPAKTDTKPDTKKDDKPAPPPPEPRKPGPDDPKAIALLDKIAAGPDADARKAAIAQLDALVRERPAVIEAIAEYAQRAHKTDADARRQVLTAINASVPDASGKFSGPVRQTGKERKADDDVDWMPSLLALDPATIADPPPPPPPPKKRGEPPPPPPEIVPIDKPLALSEVIADVAAIRAMARLKEVRAAQLVFDTAFHPESMVYRDECGRFLRKMEPYSIPALVRESAQSKSFDRRRYATWQLERLDRQDPRKAVDAAAGDEALQLAIIDMYRVTKIREAVGVMWTKVNDDSPRIRAAARAAWMEYITGKAPPLAPRKKLMLPGGKLTKKEKPLWLNYRELADTELRKAANELLQEDYPLDEEALDDSDAEKKWKPKLKLDLVETTNRLFAHYDSARAEQEAAQWAAAKAKADAGDLAAATTMLDRLIARNPDRRDAAAMAKVYAQWGKQLEGKQQWGDAAAAYSKAYGLDPQPDKKILAKHHHALGKSLEASGKDGGPDFRIAIALDASYEPAQVAAERAADGPPGRPLWMLVAAVSIGVVAMLLFTMAMLRRRA